MATLPKAAMEELNRSLNEFFNTQTDKPEQFTKETFLAIHLENSKNRNTPFRDSIERSRKDDGDNTQ